MLLERRFLHGLVCQPFDHNLSRLGVFCPELVRHHARRALGLDVADSKKFRWRIPLLPADAVVSMSRVLGLPDGLQPRSFSDVRAADWQVGVPRLMPKWKAPGSKWRLIINKRRTPCNRLHGLICRALDTLLDNFPKHLWSDFTSPSDFLTDVHAFNIKTNEMFKHTVSFTLPADMCDCFHHIPVGELRGIWEELKNWWLAQGISAVSVPRGRRRGCGQLGPVDLPGWEMITFDNITRALIHFADTNFLTVAGLGQEIQGVPMGDALSCAALRLFKWWRERTCGREESGSVLRYPGERTQLVHLHGCNVLVLDVSFRDDLRLFCVWDATSRLSVETVRSWCIQRMCKRFVWGSMRIEPSDPELFSDINTYLDGYVLSTLPDLRDPWAAHTYNSLDVNPLKACSWGPLSQKSATIRGVLARCWYLSSNRKARITAFWHALCAFILKANFPRAFVARTSKRWASSWVPKSAGSHSTCSICSPICWYCVCFW